MNDPHARRPRRGPWSGRCGDPGGTRSWEDGALEDIRTDRYAGWEGELGSDILDGRATLASLRERMLGIETEPTRVSGRQEEIENLVARYVERAR